MRALGGVPTTREVDQGDPASLGQAGACWRRLGHDGRGIIEEAVEILSRLSSTN